MTDRDIDLINNNIKLVYKYFIIKKITDEDLKQDLLYHLCKRIHCYDESKGKLSVFIYKVLDNRVKTLYTTNARKHLDTISIANKAEGIAIYDVMPYKENTEKNFEIKTLINLAIENTVKKTNAKNSFDKSDYYDIINMIIEGYNTREISNIYNCSKQNIQIIITKIRKELKSLLEEQNEKNCN